MGYLGPSRAAYDERLPISLESATDAQSAPARTIQPRTGSKRKANPPASAAAPDAVRGKGSKSVSAQHAEKPNGPLQIVISIDQQSLTVYSGGNAVAHSRVSTGVPGHATPTGVFSIIQKNRFHRSNIYSGAPMPFMQRITWSGVALHEGVVPGHPASHGCIRMPPAFAKQLWSWTKLGARVVITRSAITPVEITHPHLAALTQSHAPVAAKMPPPANAAPRASLIEGVPKATLDLRPPMRIAASMVIASDAMPEGTSAHQPRNEPVPAPQADAQPADAQAVNIQANVDLALPDYPPALVLDIAALPVPAAPTAPRSIGVDETTDLSALMAKRVIEAATRVTESAKPAQNAVQETTQMTTQEAATVDLAPPDYPPALAIDPPTAPVTAASVPAPPVTAVAARAESVPPPPASIEIIAPDYPPPAIDIPLSDLAAALEFERPIQKGPVSVFISRKERKLYVRQDFHAVFSAPVKIERPDAPLGTHIFTALGTNDDGATMRWNALTLPTSPAKKAEPARHTSSRVKHAKIQAIEDTTPHHLPSAADALERITIPPAIAQRVFAFMAAGSSLTISDQGLGPETGRGTDFIVLTR